MNIIFQSIRSSWKGFLLGTLLSIGSGVCAILVIKTVNQYLKAELHSDDLHLFIIKFLTLLVGFAIFAITSTILLSRLSHRIVYDLRMTFGKKIINAHFEEIEYKKEKLINIIANDINTISRIIDKIPGIFTRAAISIGGIIYLFYVSWQLSLFVISLFSVVFVLVHITNKRLRKISGRARQAWNSIFHQFNDLIYGIKEMAMNSAHQRIFLESRLPEACEEEYIEKVKERTNIQVSSKLSEVLLLMGVGTVIIVVGFMESISTVTFIEFLTVTLFIIGPLSTIVEFTKGLNPLYAAMDQIRETGIFLDQRKASETRIAQLEATTPQPIQLKKVSYKYFDLESDSFFELGPVDLTIPVGEITMIIGSNGSGKTTLGKIIAGLYRPRQGELLYGDTKLETSLLQSYRDQFGAIFTDNYLFENFDYITDLDISKAKEYLKLFNLDNKVDIVNQSFSSTNLSSGQRKRLALIISLLENKRLYIFDEWPANQDPQYKEIFYYEILPTLKASGKTIIVITHDDKYFNCADYLVKLSEGQIVHTEKTEKKVTAST